MQLIRRLFPGRDTTVLEQQDPLEQAQGRVNRNPNDADAHFDLGSLHYVRRDYDEAVRALTRAVELAPDMAGAHYMLGLTYVQLNRREDARQAFEQARRLTSNPMLQGYAANKLKELEE